MKKIILLLFTSIIILNLAAQPTAVAKRVTSTIDSSIIGELVLIQEFEVAAPIKSVWEAYTTKHGWEHAFVPKAKVDFRIGGTILTNYNKDGEIGDSNTIVLHIINYVPEKLLTLQAELTQNFPDFMKAEAKNLYNVIYFESINPNQTKVTSYGIGYLNNDKYLGLMKFFISGNEMSYLNFIAYLETGEKVKY